MVRTAQKPQSTSMWRPNLFPPLRFVALSLLLLTPALAWADEPTPAALAALTAYTERVEVRLAQQHRPGLPYLASAGATPEAESRLRRGEPLLQSVTEAAKGSLTQAQAPVTAGALPGALPGALLHHWRGTAFVPGGRAQAMAQLLRDFDGYPRIFAPEVLRARGVAGPGDTFQAALRVRERHVLTVVLDTTYDVQFSPPDVERGYSLSRSTRVTEIGSAGTAAERTLSPAEEHGFLWRQNTYWSWEERDGGLYLQVESVSLTRSIPPGLGWVARPFVVSVPRDSLRFTLNAITRALGSHPA